MSVARRTSSRALRAPARGGFTLVELLVVIGIIALLISILLPALGAARRQANAVKCASAMREMGQAMNLYSIDNKGYLPPAQIYDNASHPYNIGGYTYSAGNTFLADFLAKYVTKGKFGVTSTTNNDAADIRKSVLWGCPSWDGYVSSTLGGVNRVQSGIGMNAIPAYEANYPASGVNLAWAGSGTYKYSGSVIYPPAAANTWDGYFGVWNKYKAWTHPAERCLLADSLFWIADSYSAPTDGSFPGGTRMNNNNAYPTSNSTTIDWYRHGKYPPIDGAKPDQFMTNGGKVAYNILFADLHVATQTDRAAAYRSIRMRYPG